MRTADGYRATKDAKGVLTVHDVPIFPTHYRSQKGKLGMDGKPVKFSGHYTRDWLDRAVQWAREQQRGHYEPPLNIYHHSPIPEENARVQNVGRFAPKKVQVVTYKGKRLPCIIADLKVTRQQYQDAIIRGEYPYFSVEIFNVDKPPQINALSLLDHMEPFFQLPMLEVGEVRDEAEAPAPWSMSSADPDTALVACYSAGLRQASLFHRLTMAEEQNTEEFGAGVDAPAATAEVYEQGGDDAPSKEAPPQASGEGDGESETEGDASKADDFDIEPILEAIKAKTISVGAQEALIAELKASLAAAAGAEQPAQQPQQQQPAPATLPAGEAMSAEQTDSAAEQYAAEAAKNVALEARIAALEADSERDKAVTSAKERLEGRGIGGDLDEKLSEFYSQCGGNAETFGKFVEALETYAAPAIDDNVAPMTPVASDVSEVVVAYQEHGPEAIKHATFYSDAYQANAAAGMAGGMDEQTYVAINMDQHHGIKLATA